MNLRLIWKINKYLGNIDSEPVESTKDLRRNAVPFTEHLYEWDEARIKKYMSKSKNGVCYIEFQYKQIGMGEDYFKRMVAVLNGERIKIKREILLYRIRGAADSPFNEEDLDYINANKKDPKSEIVIKDVYIIKLYDELHPEYPYIFSIDPATGSGVGSDNTAMNIIDPYTLISIGVLKTPYSDAVETSEIIVDIIMHYIPKCMLVIERNSLGSSIIAILARTPVSGNMYYDSTKTLELTGEDKLNRKGYMDVSPSSRRYWGVTTMNKNRDIMTKEILTNLVQKHKDKFIAAELIDDLNNLCVKSSGRIEARQGEHDDVVMSYLIGLYVYQYGKNINQWGIIKGMAAPKPHANPEEEYTYEDYYERLPANLKKIFPKPGESVNMVNQVTQTPEVLNGSKNGFLDGAKSNEIYDQIQKMQSQRTRKVQQSDGSYVTVKSNVATEDIVHEAAYGGSDGIDDDMINLCNFLTD